MRPPFDPARALAKAAAFFVFLLCGCATPAALPPAGAVGAPLAVATPVVVKAAKTKGPVTLTFQLKGEIDRDMGKLFLMFLEAARKVHASLELRIDSPGGDADVSMGMHEAVRLWPRTVTCVVEGMAASGAFVVLQGCDRRVARPKAKLMTHRQLTEIRYAGSPIGMDPDTHTVMVAATLTVEAMEEQLLVLGRIFQESLARAREIDAVVYTRLGLTQEAYLARVGKGAAWWLTPQQALAARALDAVEAR